MGKGEEEEEKDEEEGRKEEKEGSRFGESDGGSWEVGDSGGKKWLSIEVSGVCCTAAYRWKTTGPGMASCGIYLESCRSFLCR